MKLGALLPLTMLLAFSLPLSAQPKSKGKDKGIVMAEPSAVPELLLFTAGLGIVAAGVYKRRTRQAA